MGKVLDEEQSEALLAPQGCDGVELCRFARGQPPKDHSCTDADAKGEEERGWGDRNGPAEQKMDN